MALLTLSGRLKGIEFCYNKKQMKEGGACNMTMLKIISNKEDATDVIKSAISAEIKRMEIGLNRTKREIKSFEEKYKMSSETFAKEFAAEDLKRGDDEYIRWAGELEMSKRIKEELKKLKDIEYVAA